MGWWQDTLKAAGDTVKLWLGTTEKEYSQWDKELEAQRGIGPALLRAFLKVFRLILKMAFSVGDAIFPGLNMHVQQIYTGRILEIPKPVWTDTIKLLAKSLGLDAESTTMLHSFYQPLIGASPIVQGLAVLGIFTTLMQYIMGTGLGKVVQSMGMKYRPSLPGAGEVLGARALDPALDDQIWKVLQRNGYPDEDIKLLFASTYARVPEFTIRNLYYRESRSAEWAANRLSELGYTPERVKEIMASWPALPSVQDLIYMVEKEAFEPQIQRMFGLDLPAPGLYLDWAQKIGYPQYWAQKMWEAHWEHPSLQLVLDMFHRDLLDWDHVYEYMTIVELPPFWRDKIRDAAYNVITRVDARRMYGTGTITDQELFDTYRHMGYSPQDAARLTDFSIKYETGAERDVAKEDILRAYGYKDIPQATALDWLQQLGYSTEIAEFYLKQKDLELDRKRTADALTVIKDKYTGNLITRAEAQVGLVGAGMNPATITDQLESWEVTRIKNTKLPSKTDLDKFLRAEIIDRDSYRTEMTKLGYSELYIKWYLALIAQGGQVSAAETD